MLVVAAAAAACIMCVCTKHEKMNVVVAFRRFEFVNHIISSGFNLLLIPSFSFLHFCGNQSGTKWGKRVTKGETSQEERINCFSFTLLPYDADDVHYKKHIYVTSVFPSEEGYNIIINIIENRCVVKLVVEQMKSEFYYLVASSFSCELSTHLKH